MTKAVNWWRICISMHFGGHFWCFARVPQLSAKALLQLQVQLGIHYCSALTCDSLVNIIQYMGLGTTLYTQFLLAISTSCRIESISNRIWFPKSPYKVSWKLPSLKHGPFWHSTTKWKIWVKKLTNESRKVKMRRFLYLTPTFLLAVVDVKLNYKMWGEKKI